MSAEASGSGKRRAPRREHDYDNDTSMSEPVSKQARLSTPVSPAVSRQVTVAQAVHTKLEWKIESFAKVLRLYKPEQNLCSRAFWSPACPSISWELHVYPNGKREEDAGNASFFLRQTGMQNWTAYEALFAEFQIYCLREGEDKLSVCRDTKEFTHQQGRGKFKVPRERIEQAIQSDGSLHVICEIEFFVPGSQPFVDEEATGNNSDADDGEHVDTCDLGKLLRNQILPDCVIKVGAERLEAHRCILALHSDVFRSCFAQEGMVEAKDGVIEITDSFLQPVQGMLEWMYNGHTKFMSEYSENILELAEKYGILRLKARCERFLASSLSEASVCQLIVFADLHNAKHLMTECQYYIGKHQKEVLNSDEWKYLKRHNSRLAADVLQNMITGAAGCSSSWNKSSSSPASPYSTSPKVEPSGEISSVRVIVDHRATSGDPAGGAAAEASGSGAAGGSRGDQVQQPQQQQHNRARNILVRRRNRL